MSDNEASRKRPLEQEAEAADSRDLQIQNESKETPVAKKARAVQRGADPVETTPRPSPSSVESHPPAGRPSEQSVSAADQSQQPRLQQQPPQQQLQQQYRPSKLEHAFFGTEVMDDVVRTIGEFLFEHCHHSNVEIEAKLGVLTDKTTGRRIELPVRNEVVLAPQGRPTWYQFTSDMTVDQHAHFNKMLNWRLEQIRKTEPKERQIRYQHTYEIDQFFNSPGGGKLRVTRDQNTKEVIANGIVKKERIADLDIFSPRNAFDFRISVNIEVPVPAPTPGSMAQFERYKNRVSYRHNNFKIDLTQVKSANTPNTNNSNRGPPNYSQMNPLVNNNSNNNQDLTHELEIEFVHPEELVRERDIRLKSGGKQQDRFMDIVGHFVNNVRGLVVRGNIQPQRPH